MEEATNLLHRLMSLSSSTCLIKTLRNTRNKNKQKKIKAKMTFSQFLFSYSYLFRQKHRSGPREAKTAKTGPRASPCLWGAGEVSSSSPLLKSWLSSRARGCSQPARRARESWQVERLSLPLGARRERVTYADV